jgi:threonine dehydrogenase-like Zn-dependent dehydrogenase
VISALELAIPGGTVGRVGIPEDETLPGGVPFWKNVNVSGGPSPVRAYIEELLADVLDGEINPGASSTGWKTSTECRTATVR